MLDQRLQETERRSWLYVGTWTLLIFLTVPLARSIQAYVREHWGREMFLFGVIASILAFLLLALWQLIRTQRRVSGYNYVALLTVSGIFVA